MYRHTYSHDTGSTGGFNYILCVKPVTKCKTITQLEQIKLFGLLHFYFPFIKIGVQKKWRDRKTGSGFLFFIIIEWVRIYRPKKQIIFYLFITNCYKNIPKPGGIRIRQIDLVPTGSLTLLFHHAFYTTFFLYLFGPFITIFLYKIYDYFHEVYIYQGCCEQLFWLMDCVRRKETQNHEYL